MLIRVAQKVITYDDVQYMFEKPSSDSWNSRVSTAPSHGLYLYDIGYDEADLALPIKPEQVNTEDQVEIPLSIRKEIIKQRIENRRIALDARVKKSIEKIKSHELLKSNKK